MSKAITRNLLLAPGTTLARAGTRGDERPRRTADAVDDAEARVKAELGDVIGGLRRVREATVQLASAPSADRVRTVHAQLDQHLQPLLSIMGTEQGAAVQAALDALLAMAGEGDTTVVGSGVPAWMDVPGLEAATKVMAWSVEDIRRHVKQLFQAGSWERADTITNRLFTGLEVLLARQDIEGAVSIARRSLANFIVPEEGPVAAARRARSRVLKVIKLAEMIDGGRPIISLGGRLGREVTYESWRVKKEPWRIEWGARCDDLPIDAVTQDNIYIDFKTRPHTEEMGRTLIALLDGAQGMGDSPSRAVEDGDDLGDVFGAASIARMLFFFNQVMKAQPEVRFELNWASPEKPQQQVVNRMYDFLSANKFSLIWHRDALAEGKLLQPSADPKAELYNAVNRLLYTSAELMVLGNNNYKILADFIDWYVDEVSVDNRFLALSEEERMEVLRSELLKYVHIRGR